MERKLIAPRKDWQKKCEDSGFIWHTVDGVPYWNESVCYHFSEAEILKLESVTEELHAKVIEAVQWVIDNKAYDRFQIPQSYIPLIEASWNDNHPYVYGRFDLAWDGIGEPKMLEYNADTPTSAFETGVVQWEWMEEVFPHTDQFNSVHDKLIARWKMYHAQFKRGLVFAALGESDEDIGTVNYLRDTAEQAGIPTSLISVEDIGWDADRLKFVDMKDDEIQNLFKLYPWEWMMNEEFGAYVPTSSTRFIEPAWKVLASSKAILPVLWKLFPNHPNLLPAIYAENFTGYGDWVSKPVYSREGANIEIIKQGAVIDKTDGFYEDGPRIYQQLHPLFNNGNIHTVIGSWVIGDEAAGISLREDDGLITRNLSRFIPHYFT